MIVVKRTTKWARPLVQGYIQDTTTVRTSYMTGSFHLAEHNFLANAASPILKLNALANATKPGCKVSAGPADWLCRDLPCETHNLEAAPRRSHTHASASSVYVSRPPPPSQPPARSAGCRLTAAPHQHRAAASSPQGDCSYAAIRTTSPAALAGPW